MAQNSIDIVKSGDTVSQEICFIYNGGIKSGDAGLLLGGLDAEGIVIEDVQVNQGVIDPQTGVWQVAALIPGKEYCASISFTVEDTCILKDGVEFTISDNCGCGVDACVKYKAIGCCFVADCVEGVIANSELDCSFIGAH